LLGKQLRYHCATPANIFQYTQLRGGCQAPPIE
jgi:hypothetical protein